VRTLEEQGIGRPSTYAPTIATIISRGYIKRQNRTLVPTELGEVVTDLLAEHFSDVVNIEFTASMEEQLDEVEEGQQDWHQVIAGF
jgi:DNA topoisomerase-1